MNVVTKTLESKFRAAGLACELDPGPIGIVVYARTPAIVSAVASQLAKALRALGVNVTVEAPEFVADESAETAYSAAACFDWDAMPRAVAPVSSEAK